MISLEQVKLLESKVAKTIDYVNKVTGENSALKEKLFSYEKRIGELEVLVQRFNDTQNRIESGILSAIERLNQFEDAIETKLSSESLVSTEGKPKEDKAPPSLKIPQEKKDTEKKSYKDAPEPLKQNDQKAKGSSGGLISQGELDSPEEPGSPGEQSSEDELGSPELDIF